MIGLMMVMLMVFFTCDKLVPILRNGCGIRRQNYVALFQENEMSVGLHPRDLILGLQCFFCLIYPVEELSLLFLWWCESRDLGSRRS